MEHQAYCGDHITGSFGRSNGLILELRSVTTRPFLGLWCCLPILSLYPTPPMWTMGNRSDSKHTSRKSAGLGAAQSFISQPVQGPGQESLQPRVPGILPTFPLPRAHEALAVSMVNLRHPVTYRELPNLCAWDMWQWRWEMSLPEDDSLQPC